MGMEPNQTTSRKLGRMNQSIVSGCAYPCFVVRFVRTSSSYLFFPFAGVPGICRDPSVYVVHREPAFFYCHT